MAPGLIVGGWFVSGILSKLITELVECAKDHKKKLGLKEDELARLKKQLPKIEAVVTAVDQGLIRGNNEPLNIWLWQLRDDADQADDVMDEIRYHLAKEKLEGPKNKVSKALSNVRTFLKRVVDNDPILKRLKKVVKEIDEVAAGIENFYMLVKDLDKKQNKAVESHMSNRQTSSVLNVRTRVFGREKEKKNIITKLLNPVVRNKDVNYSILPLIGVGGIGKTTLAQYVYNDPEMEKHFDLRMWKRADFDNLDSIQTELVNKLKSKRFLVVFDDAWNDNDRSGWEKLFAPLKSGESGSMILLTTREISVARLTGLNLLDSYILKGLDKESTWDLFEVCAFGDENPRYHGQLIEIGREIVKKLMGSPLAAETVGRICSNLNMEHWKSVLNSELWSLPQGPNDIMPALKLTYLYLPSHLKPCFSFCSVFPQDSIFIKDDLVNMWIALGLVLVTAKEKLEDVGSKYFEDLLDRSIFSQSDQAGFYGGEFIRGYIMHDLMHDLSAFVAQGECYRCDTDNLEYVPPTVRHLFIRVGDCRAFKLSKPLKNVRTLIMQFSNFNQNLDCFNELFKEIKSLRVLELYSTVGEIPTGVSNQLHLRYLSTSPPYFLTEFPQSISSLYLLETLVFYGSEYNIRADVLVKLINIRHLIASQSFVKTIANIGNLTSLQELPFCVCRESGFEICQLRDMRELRNLSISNINGVDSHEEVIEAKLSDKHSLWKLSLQWDNARRLSLQRDAKMSDEKVFDAKRFHEKVFDNLEPHSGLKELIIENYPGGRPPVWWKDQSSTSESLPLALEKLTISKCKELELPYGYLKKLASLKKLNIIDCPKIDPFVLAFFLPSQSICINDVYVDLNADGPHELSLQPTQQEGALFVIDCPDYYPMKFLRMRDHYTGKWPPTWFTQNLSMLEHLSIDGETYRYLSDEPSNPVNQLLALAKKTGKYFYGPLEIVYPLDMLELEQFYCISQHIEQIQRLKKLTVTAFSESFVVPPLPHPLTLKELRLVHLNMNVIPNLYEHQSRESGRLPSLVSLEIFDCRKLVSLAEGLLQNLEQFPALKELTISNCEELVHLPEGGFEGFISLRKLHIGDCQKLCAIPPLPVALEELRLTDLKMDVIPNLYENQSRESGRSLPLVALTIDWYPNLVSLAEGLLQNPEQFPALKELTIDFCEKLEYLPEGGFDGFISLRKLHINGCPKLSRQLPRTTGMNTKTGNFRFESDESVEKRREASQFWWFWNGDAIYTT